MSITSLQSQISGLEKEIINIDKKTFDERKKIIDKEKQINSINKSINKSMSNATLKSKENQILKYRKEILVIQQKLNGYEKQKHNKRVLVNKKTDSLKKEEIFLQRREHSQSKESNSSSDLILDLASIKMPANKEQPETFFMEDANNNLEPISVFISYSWDSREHEDKVFDFANHLRTSGFEADIDKSLSQQETAINFVKMMHKAMHDYKKVIVVLSKGYKEKADSFKGGVGTEYELMINDIIDNPNKYILASFNGRDNEIIPAGFKGRDIIDLSRAEEMTRLFEKLMDHKRYILADVAKIKPVLPIRVAQAFAVEAAGLFSDHISIETLIKETGNSSLLARKYRSIEFLLKFSFTNLTGATIEGFNYNIRLPRELDLDHYYDSDPDGFVNHQRTFEGKLFQKQKITTEGFLLKVAHQNIRRIIESSIKVEIYAEQGSIEKTFLANEIIRIKPGGESHLETVPLSSDLFI